MVPSAIWIARLRAIALPAVPEPMKKLIEPASDDDEPRREAQSRRFIETFADDAGDRRPVDRPLLAHMLHCGAGEMPASLRPDELAWWCCHTRGAYHRLPLDWKAAGRLFPEFASEAIETWTDTELSAVHALAWEGLRGRNHSILSRVARAAEWLLNEVQPDNATERPWAIHVFAAMSLDASRSPEARAAADLYAQTLLNNAMVGRERPDRFSACLLWDAADWLETASQSSWQRPPPLLEAIAPWRSAKPQTG